MTRGPDDLPDLTFRTAAAPGLEEDDLFAALLGLPGQGALWGEGVPAARPPGEEPWDEERERRRRHEDVLRRWQPPAGPDGTAEAPEAG